MKRLTIMLTVLWGTAVFILVEQRIQAQPADEPFLPPISQNLELVDQFGGIALTLTVHESWLYTVFGSRLVVFDVSDSANPQEVGQLTLATNHIVAMTMIGDALYLSGYDGYLYIVHVGNPASPYLLQQYQFENTLPQNVISIPALATSGNYLYVAYYEYSYDPYENRVALATLDVSDPVRPLQTDVLYFPYEYVYPNSLVVEGDNIYLTTQFDNNGWLRLVDITNPAMPTVLSTYSDEDIYAIDAVAVSGDYVVLSVSGRLDVIDVSQPTTPIEVGGVHFSDYFAYSLAIKNDYIYVLGDTNLHIIDFLNPVQPGQTFTTTALYTGNSMIITDDQIYLTTDPYDQPGGFQILGLSTPTVPVLLGGHQERLRWDAYTIQVVADQIYVQASGGKSYRLPVDGLSPVTASIFYFSPTLVKNDFAFNPGFAIYDVSNPQYPAWIGSTYGGQVVDVVGDYAYVGTPIYYYDGAYFRIIDISDYATPIVISEYYFPTDVDELFVIGNYAYVLSGSLFVFDVSDPYTPVLVTTYELGNGEAMARYRQYALVTTYDRLFVLDLADPIAPVTVGDYELVFGEESWNGYEIDIHKRWAFVSVRGKGLEVWDLSDMAQLSLAGWHLGDIADVAFYGDEIFGVGSSGFFHWRWLVDDVWAVLPPSGGNFTTTDGNTAFSFGSEAFTDTIQVDYQALNRPNDQGELWGMNRFFEVTAVTSTTHQLITTFTDPYTITLAYDNTGAVVEESLALYFWDGTQWLIEPSSTLNSSQQTLTATPTRLGRFAVLGETNQVYLPAVWHNGNIRDTRLVLSLDEPAAANQFGDSSGYAHHGQCTGEGCPVAGVPGVRGMAVQFDGLNDYISLGDPKELRTIRQGITIAAWVKPASDEGVQNIVAHGYSLQPEGEVFLRIENGRYQIGSWNGSDHLASFPIPATDIGQWVYLVGVYDGTAWRLYHNGVEASVTTDETGAVFVYEDWAVGANGEGNSRFFQGSIDEVAIYARGLSATAVTNLYQNYLNP